MWKDPEHKNDTPYDILGLSPNATHEQLKQALPNFLRNPKNAKRIGEAQRAHQQLRDVRQRAVVDLLYYNIRAGEDIPHGGEVPHIELKDLQVLPVVAPDQLPTDLPLIASLAPPLTPVARVKPLVEIKRFTDPQTAIPGPVFER